MGFNVFLYCCFIYLFIYILIIFPYDILLSVSQQGAVLGGALGATAPSQARTVFKKKIILLTKNAYYNMYYHTTRTSI
jgi:hypothetical protein